MKWDLFRLDALPVSGHNLLNACKFYVNKITNTEFQNIGRKILSLGKAVSLKPKKSSKSEHHGHRPSIWSQCNANTRWKYMRKTYVQYDQPVLGQCAPELSVTKCGHITDSVYVYFTASFVWKTLSSQTSFIWELRTTRAINSLFSRNQTARQQ